MRSAIEAGGLAAFGIDAVLLPSDVSVRTGVCVYVFVCCVVCKLTICVWSNTAVSTVLCCSKH